MAAVKKVVIWYTSHAEVEVYGINADATADEIRAFINNDPALSSSVRQQRDDNLVVDSMVAEHIATV